MPASYIGGVAASSLVFVLVLDSTLGSLARRETIDARVALSIVVVALLLIADLGRVWLGRTTSFGPNRQTPYRLQHRGHAGIALWGLDTGVPITTVRSTAWPMIGVALLLGGFGRWWYGLLYCAGVSLGLLSAIRNPANDDGRIVIRRLLTRGARLRTGPLMVLPQAAVLVVLGAILAL